MTKQKKHKPKNRLRKNYPGGGWAGVCSYSPSTLGARSLKLAWTVRPHSKKETVSRWKHRGRTTKKNEERYKATAHKHSEKTMCKQSPRPEEKERKRVKQNQYLKSQQRIIFQNWWKKYPSSISERFIYPKRIISENHTGVLHPNCRKSKKELDVGGAAEVLKDRFPSQVQWNLPSVGLAASQEEHLRQWKVMRKTPRKRKVENQTLRTHNSKLEHNHKPKESRTNDIIKKGPN